MSTMDRKVIKPIKAFSNARDAFGFIDDGTWSQHIPRIYKTFAIPTEVVIYEGTTNVTPNYGRAYCTNLYWKSGEGFCSYNSFSSYEERNASQLILVEDWEDGGDDGHTRYHITQYLLVLECEVDYLLHRYLPWNKMQYYVDIEESISDKVSQRMESNEDYYDTLTEVLKGV